MSWLVDNNVIGHPKLLIQGGNVSVAKILLKTDISSSWLLFLLGLILVQQIKLVAFVSFSTFFFTNKLIEEALLKNCGEKGNRYEIWKTSL